MNSFSDLIQTVLIYALPVLFAITLHEAAHGLFQQSGLWIVGMDFKELGHDESEFVQTGSG